MTEIDPTMIARIDAIMVRTLGRPFNECSVPEVLGVLAAFSAETAVIVAGIDQYEAAVTEAERCGCSVAAPNRSDGIRDLSRTRVVHRPECLRSRLTGAF